MVKQKASPGKRFCKKCEKLIPIHCRICNFCDAPQYTMQQIANEYKKRQKCMEDEESKESNLMLFNPFESSLPITVVFESNPFNYLPNTSLIIQHNNSKLILTALESEKSSEFYFLNTCGHTNSLAFSYSSPTYLCLSISNDELTYGNIYEGDGVIELWDVNDKPKFAFLAIHQGRTMNCMKFLPAKSSGIIGTLAGCSANGDVSVYNLPFTEEKVMQLQPIQIFRVPGLIFSCITWTSECLLAGGTQDGSIFSFVPGCDAISKQFSAHKLPITSITWIQSSQAIATTSLDGNLKIWNKNLSLIDKICLSKRWSYNVCSNPIGKYLFYDIDAVIAPHKIIEFANGKLESKKQISNSTEGTVCSCFSSVSSFVYIATAEGFIEGIYVSELEKNSKKRKTPWNRYKKIVRIDRDFRVVSGEEVQERAVYESGNIKKLEIFIRKESELIAWTGVLCGIYKSNLDVYT